MGDHILEISRKQKKADTTIKKFGIEVLLRRYTDSIYIEPVKAKTKPNLEITGTALSAKPKTAYKDSIMYATEELLIIHFTKNHDRITKKHINPEHKNINNRKHYRHNHQHIYHIINFKNNINNY